MSFNSFEFLVFFPLVAILYFILPFRFRWLLLLIASYVFYMSWRAEYILLIIGSTIIDYVAAIKMSQTEDKRKRKKFLFLSLVSNLSLLFTFKYFNFFSENFNSLSQALQLESNPILLNVLLPVGISFYTFQTMSYSIDVYNGKTTVEKHFGRFALFVSFFPQLVAGPIERSNRLLPQFKIEHKFNYDNARYGLMLFAWGLFKKVIIADRVSYFVNMVYNDPTEYYGFHILFATIFFAIQIYCDFSGYSDMAIGLAKVLGFDLMKNFDRPYLSKSIGEFWRRWHISLSTWFKDYVYIPLGGNRVVKWRWYYNLFITFLISGLWHGANWTFIVWGALHGVYLILENVSAKLRDESAEKIGLKNIPLLNNFLKLMYTFLLVNFAWIFFRANNISDAFILIKNLFVLDLNQIHLRMFGPNYYHFVIGIVMILIMETIHVLQNRHSMYQLVTRQPKVVRWSLYLILVTLIINFGVYGDEGFIYFQF